ncbi:MAG: ribonuclease III domain-containing protein [Promethearchaeota archaeon]
MKEKLKWNAIGLVKKTGILRDYIQNEKNNIPINHTSKFQKLTGFLDELDHLLDQMEKIEKIIIPKLEKLFRLKFTTPELVMFALSRPSIRNIFDDLKTHFKTDSNAPLTENELNDLASSGDAADVLALLGDAALDLSIVQLLWDSSLSKTGGLTEKRKDVVSNQNLANYCDDWGLFTCRLSRLRGSIKGEAKEETIIHEKATLVESILGVIYLEFGLEILLRVVPLIQ